VSWGPPPLPGDGAPDRAALRRRNALIAGGVTAALVIGGGVLLVRAGDDSGGSDRAVEEEDDDETTEPAPESTSPVATTVAATTAITTAPPPTVAPTIAPSTAAPVPTAPPATVAVTQPPPTAAPTVAPAPSDALDLGLGVSMPLPPGWEILIPAPEPLITDGNVVIRAFAVARSAGEDPAILLQEHIDSFEAGSPAVSYRPAMLFNRLDGVVPVDQYGVTYLTFDPEEPDGLGVLGTAYVFVRADGLNVVYDVFARAGTDGGLEQSAYDRFQQSILAAPPIADPVALAVREPFRVASVFPFVQVGGPAGYTAAPGYTPKSRPDGTVFVENALGGFEVQRLPETGSVEGAARLAIQLHNRTYRGLIYQQPVVVEGPREGILRADVTWTGPLAGRTGFGAFSIFYDARSLRSFVVFRGWFDVAEDPSFPATNFMFRSFADSFTAI